MSVQPTTLCKPKKRTKPKRRKKKRAYHTGVYVSKKTGQECKYRSGWEAKYLAYLDEDPDVVSYVYEPFKIPYLSNKKTGRIRYYIPDVIVTRLKSRNELVEIKPQNKLNKQIVIKKSAVGKLWADAHGVTYKIITERELKALGVI